MPDLRETIAAWHDPDAALAEGYVCRIWEDLEVTMTKSGSLLNQRNEHMIEPGNGAPIPLDMFPCRYGSHAFIFVSYAKYEAARHAISACADSFYA